MAFAELSPGVVARAKCGDEDAFHLIFNRYGRPVLSFIHNFVHDRDLAEELAQETFVRAHRNLGGLKDDLRLSTWLFGVTPLDVQTFAGVLLVLLVVATLATLVPAFRVARIDPVRALRAD